MDCGPQFCCLAAVGMRETRAGRLLLVGFALLLLFAWPIPFLTPWAWHGLPVRAAADHQPMAHGAVLCPAGRPRGVCQRARVQPVVLPWFVAKKPPWPSCCSSPARWSAAVKQKILPARSRHHPLGKRLGKFAARGKHHPVAHALLRVSGHTGLFFQRAHGPSHWRSDCSTWKRVSLSPTVRRRGRSQPGKWPALAPSRCEGIRRAACLARFTSIPGRPPSKV